jgi:ATP-dependent Clp protease protease subunit
MGKKGKKKTKEEIPEEEGVVFTPEDEEPKQKGPYLLTLYGKIEEEQCAEAVHSLYAQKLAVEKGLRSKEPLKFLVSTFGGDAVEMFSVYDMIRHVKKTYPVHTVGVGKIMSAGTLILAAGTKGKRKIGSNCRVMIHNVKGGPGPECYEVLSHEIKEIEWFQEQYVQCLAKETHLTEDEVREIIDSRHNIYLDAKQAIDVGLADKII